MKTDSLILNEGDHTYWLGKQRFPSVSEILAPVCSFDGVPVEILERKSAIGKAAHLLCEWHDRKEPIERRSIDPAVLPYFVAYKDFVKKMKPKWSLIEHRDYHPTLGYAGTLDRFGRIGALGDGCWMVDLKTVATVSPATGLQTAAYEGIRQARTAAGAPAKRAALQLKPDGTWKLQPFTDPADWPTFLSLKTIHGWRAKHSL